MRIKSSITWIIVLTGILALNYSLAKAEERNEKASAISWSPLISYTPTYGILLGGSFFRKVYSPPGFDVGVYALSSLKPNFTSMINLDYLQTDRTIHRFELHLSTFFAAYYGEGDQTRVEDRVDFSKFNMKLRIGTQVSLAEYWTIFPHLDDRFWRESDSPSRFETENAMGPAMTLGYDTRKSEDFFKQWHQATFRYLPSFFSTGSSASSFLQQEIDFRLFWDPIDSVTLASRLFMGSSFGNPSYQFRYTLGGPERLRGFFENRFRGKYIGLLQEEVRFPIWRVISGAGFLELLSPA